MKDDRFIKKVLIVIAFLLALNIVLAVLYNSPVSHAAKGFEYKVVEIYEIGYGPGESKLNRKLLTASLNEYNKEGWELFLWLDGYDTVVFKR